MYKSLTILVVFFKDDPSNGRFTLNFPYEVVIITSPGFLDFRLTMTLSGILGVIQGRRRRVSPCGNCPLKRFLATIEQ
jgi:hypothetical protein